MDVRHPRDMGMVREDILSNFLRRSGFLPSKYGVTAASTRVASTTGHVSRELDIVIYDAAQSISLMRRQGSYQVLPIESTYGAIQVKSKLNRKELREAFENIASFKDLKADQIAGRQLPSGGFGLIFAYDTDLDWSELVEEIKVLQAETAHEQLCNSIFVLSKGHFIFGTDNLYTLQNKEIIGANDLKLHGFPDRSNDALFSFYATVMELLDRTHTSVPPYRSYFNVPLVADKHSYQFALGHLAELVSCSKHGPFVKKISPTNLEKLLQYSQTAERKSWQEIRNAIYDFNHPVSIRPGDEIPCYFIYNPGNEQLVKILLKDIERTSVEGAKVVYKANSYDDVSITSAGLQVVIPHKYAPDIYDPCPKCKTWQAYIANNS